MAHIHKIYFNVANPMYQNSTTWSIYMNILQIQNTLKMHN